VAGDKAANGIYVFLLTGVFFKNNTRFDEFLSV
jgi:hypothetical protein